jgi:hypothetical protein
MPVGVTNVTKIPDLGIEGAGLHHKGRDRLAARTKSRVHSRIISPR